MLPNNTDFDWEGQKSKKVAVVEMSKVVGSVLIRNMAGHLYPNPFSRLNGWNMMSSKGWKPLPASDQAQS